MAISYPATILIFLGHYPKERLKQAGWVVFWVLLYSSIEFVNFYYLDLIEHSNGWSILFNIFMFIIFRIHHKRPLMAMGIGFLSIIFLWNIFDVPIELLK
jgi:hypothetical protein